jgi:transcriptional regulator with XRE-family HTH domain
MQTAFGSLMKHWRASRKMSQLDLAMEAEVSARHLSFIETGRSQPSREMVLQLAEVLEVPLRERNTLLRAAGYADLYRETNLNAPEMASVRQALAFLLDRHEPYGAFVLDREFNVLLSNRAAMNVMSRFLDAPPVPPVNLMKLLFDPSGARRYVENWEQVAQVQVQRLHREALASEPGSPVRALLSSLLASPEVPRSFRQPDLASEPSPLVPLTLRRGDLRLSLFSTIACIGTPLDVTLHELRIETFFPADRATDDALRALAAPG